MLFKSVAITAALAASTSTQFSPRNITRSCGTPLPTEAQIQASQQMLQDERVRIASGVRPLRALTVNTYFHVVAASKAEEDGYATEQQLNDQFHVLNAAYASHGITFNLLGKDWTVNPDWADDQDEFAYKEALRQGDYGTLNVYFIRHPKFKALGYCNFPGNFAEGSTDFVLDGCVIDAATVPGGSAAPYNLGGTVPHEVGHWFNLYHTFQDGCNGGDLVDDTPAQASPSFGCPVGRDSCPAEGLDPIVNYMDYSDDACYEEFTAGQQERMFSAWDTYRA
ncbi:hypothetical protein DL767_007255 [Monosporascus sp. MG133]|nr:hypothetical protein DL767_007255 [Monosporascus sp. MG133]